MIRKYKIWFQKLKKMRKYLKKIIILGLEKNDL
jgi:hypothetical protein